MIEFSMVFVESIRAIEEVNKMREEYENGQ